MDEKGYVFSSLAVLLMIPILIIAINFGEIVNEANMLADIAIGGDVTYNTAANLYRYMGKAASDTGRNSAYLATRDVIDNRRFLDDSKLHVRNNIVKGLNENVIEVCLELQIETGREIYINDIPINNFTDEVLFLEDVNIEQDDPFGFFVIVEGGIQVKVVQEGQVYEGVTPEIKSYVSLEGLEDPYIWINSRERQSNIIYKVIDPYYDYNPFTDEVNFKMDEEVDRENLRLYHLWDYLDGTGNPSGLNKRPYYFPDEDGLSFFERLENQRSAETNPKARMSTFVIGRPLEEDIGPDISIIDHEYFNAVRGTAITIRSLPPQPSNIRIRDPSGEIIYISQKYKNIFELSNHYQN